MASSSAPILSSSIFDRYLWIAGAGIFAVYAAYTTHSQLCTFKARCVSQPPPPSSNDAAIINKETEDAIKLETLEVLALSVNFDLRNAALKIITERATTEESVSFLLEQIESENSTVRLRALKAMRCLSMTSSSFSNLCTVEVFHSLVTCLKNTLPPTPDPATEKEALYIIARLMTSFFAGRDMAVHAGIISWLKLLKIPGYTSVVDAVFDPARFDPSDTSLWEIVSTIIDDTVDGRRLMIEAGLIQRSEEDERADNARAERTWENVQAGALEGLLEDGFRESERHWT